CVISGKQFRYSSPPYSIPRIEVRMNRYLPVRRQSPATAALGAVAIGAIAVGAVALGFLAINWLFVRRARFDRLEIGDLRIGRLRLRGPVEEVEPDWGFERRSRHRRGHRR